MVAILSHSVAEHGRGSLPQALRRQRKEELSRESKQTNEKLLKTFLKRQAIKAALGDRR